MKTTLKVALVVAAGIWIFIGTLFFLSLLFLEDAFDSLSPVPEPPKLDTERLEWNQMCKEKSDFIYHNASDIRDTWSEDTKTIADYYYENIPTWAFIFQNNCEDVWSSGEDWKATSNGQACITIYSENTFDVNKLHAIDIGYCDDYLERGVWSVKIGALGAQDFYP